MPSGRRPASPAARLGLAAAAASAALALVAAGCGSIDPAPGGGAAGDVGGAPGAPAVGADVDSGIAADPGGLGADAAGVAIPPRSLTVAATGDVLPHSPLWRQAATDAGGDGYDFGPMFAEIAPVLGGADLAICHLETPIAPIGEEFSTDPLYGVPPQIVDAVAAAGFDRCSTASNHAFDRGVAGIDRTVEVLEAAGVGQSGMARTEAESRPRIFVVGDVAIAHLSYTYGVNGNYVPPGQEWRVPMIDPARIVADAQAVRAEGAEVVIASIHWGTEGVAEPDAAQRAVAEAVTAAGVVDLIIGHHAHVLQPIEMVNGTWVAFGLGNILSNLPVGPQWPASSQDAAIVQFPITVTVDPDTGARQVAVGPPVARPTWVDKEHGWVIRDVLADLADPATDDWRRARLQESLERTAAVIGAYLPA